MDFDTLNKILNCLDRCQTEGKALEINIDEDLVQILPLPRKLILDLLTDQFISTFFRLSDDQKIISYENNLRLCSIDQNRGDSCQSSSCEQLHLCQNYILNQICSEFNSLGKCSHSHSLSTHHNENILRKYNLSPKDDRTFSLLSRLIQFSLIKSSKRIVQTLNKQNLTNQLLDHCLGQHKSLLKTLKIINSYAVELTFDDDEVASMMEDYINEHHSKIVSINKEANRYENNISSERPLFGRGRGRQEMDNLPYLNNQSSANSFSRRLGSNNEKKISFSQRLNSIQTPIRSTDNDDQNLIEEQVSNHRNHEKKSPSIDVMNERISPSNINSRRDYILHDNSTETLINYKYRKPFLDKHLCYLLGPGKREIMENDQCEIFSCLSLGYCRVKTIEQGKEIEKTLYQILPESLRIEPIKIHEDLALIICSSAAEEIFQQNQIHYGIITQPTDILLNIEVVNRPSLERKRSPLTSNRNSASSSSTDYENSEQSSSDGKFYINSTGSSINVISGDISEIPVDLLICASTSNNLRDNILRRAGPKIENQYKESSHPDDALLLDGGSTAARKILFVPWQTEIEGAETTKTKKSITSLVKWCIEQANQKDLKSISFPPIGTGQLGLDPFFVCEAMISTANECLQQCKLDVFFVIYPSTRNEYEDEDECYQVFRVFLNSFCDKGKSMEVSTSTTNHERQTSIKRNIRSKQIFIVSESSKDTKDQNGLIQALEDLMYEKTFDLSLIESKLIDQIEFLIDICLKSNVYPRLDYSREELILRGDYDSCLQCFCNIRQEKQVNQYLYQSNDKQMNPYISLKIDQALAVEESNISVNDDEQMIYHIDLNRLQMRLNKDKQTISLDRKQLNRDSSVSIPSSWSTSIMMIRTVEINPSSFKTLECFQIFEQTMSLKDWQIERIDSIENYPLFLHFANNNHQKDRRKLYFHGCSYSSVQSIIHYGLHSTNASHYGDQYGNSSICLTRDVFTSHLYGTRRSTDGKYYLFAVQITKKDIDDDLISLTNDQIHLTLPTYLIVYQKRKSSH